MRYIVLLLLLSSVVFAAQDVEFTLTKISQTPDPVEPGDVVEIDYKIENEGDETTEDVIIEIIPNYPLSSYDGVTEYNLGKLPASVSGSHTETVTFKLKIDEGAVGGDINLDTKISSGETTYTYDEGEYVVDVRANDAILTIDSIDVYPDKVEAGDIVQIDISLLNTADTVIKDVSYEVDLNDAPFAPYQSSSVQQIDIISSSSNGQIEYSLLVDPQASSGLYKINSTITYYDDEGTEYTVDDILAISVYETPQLRAYVKRNSIDSNTGQGDVTIEIANAGISNLKLLELTVKDSADFTLLSPTNYFYVGDIESDDTESEDITIHTDVRGLFNIPLTLSYRDLNNMQYEQDINIPITVLSKNDQYQYGLEERSYKSLIITCILLLSIAGFVWYKRKK